MRLSTLVIVTSISSALMLGGGRPQVGGATNAGSIATIAGDGIAGLSGDGGPATSAEFNGPDNVAVDASGNVYVTDYINCRVREISSGIITTIAGAGTGDAVNCGDAGDGGLAINAQLGLPGDLRFDASGALYVSDSSPYCGLHKVVSGGIQNQTGLCGVKGTPSRFTLSGGDVYIADWTNCEVWKASGPTLSTLTLIAGTGTCGYSGDGVAPTSAELKHPDGLRLDAAGNLYIADANNCRIREVSGGVITTIAGTGSCSYGGDGLATTVPLHQPEDLAFDAAGNLYISDTLNCRVRRLSSVFRASSCFRGLHGRL